MGNKDQLIFQYEDSLTVTPADKVGWTVGKDELFPEEIDLQQFRYVTTKEFVGRKVVKSVRYRRVDRR